MVAAWPRRLPSERRASGLAPDFLLPTKCQFTLNINVASLPHARTTQSIAKISSMVAGPTLHIGCYATVLFATGRQRVGRLRATDPARARSWRGRRLVEKPTGI